MKVLLFLVLFGITGCAGQDSSTQLVPPLTVVTCTHQNVDGSWIVLQRVKTPNGLVGATGSMYVNGEFLPSVYPVRPADQYQPVAFGHPFSPEECRD